MFVCACVDDGSWPDYPKMLANKSEVGSEFDHPAFARKSVIELFDDQGPS